MSADNDHLAKIAYEAWCRSRSWKDHKSVQLLHFEQQSDELKEAWIEAARAVAKEIALQTGRG